MSYLLSLSRCANKAFNLGLLTKAVFLLWVIAQLIIVLTLPDHFLQLPDARNSYIPNSLWHWQHNTFYPTSHNLYDIYIQSLGYVNFLVLVLHSFGSFKAVMLINILMNIGVVACIYHIGSFFFNKNVGFYAVMLYCLLLSNTFVPIYIMSDLPSLFFSLLGFTLALRNKWYAVFLGGLLLGICHTIRPYEIAFVIALIVFFLMNKRKWVVYILLLLPYVSVIHAAGLYSEKQTKTYVTCSTTDGFGLLKIALGDGKTDAGNGIVSDKADPHYIGIPDSLTFAQKDSLWKAKAMPGLKEKGFKYIINFPLRLLNILKFDTFFVPHPLRFFQADTPMEEIRNSSYHKLWKVGMVVNNIVYWIILLLFVIAVFVMRNRILSESGIILLILVVMFCGFAVYIAEERYHYPCISLMSIWAASMLSYENLLRVTK